MSFAVGYLARLGDARLTRALMDGVSGAQRRSIARKMFLPARTVTGAAGAFVVAGVDPSIYRNTVNPARHAHSLTRIERAQLLRLWSP